MRRQLAIDNYPHPTIRPRAEHISLIQVILFRIVNSCVVRRYGIHVRNLDSCTARDRQYPHPTIWPMAKHICYHMVLRKRGTHNCIKLPLICSFDISKMPMARWGWRWFIGWRALSNEGGLEDSWVNEGKWWTDFIVRGTVVSALKWNNLVLRMLI